MACLASWMSYKIPFLKKDKNNQISMDFSQMKFINLQMIHLPICVTVGVVKNKFLLDMNVGIFIDIKHRKMKKKYQMV